MSDRIEIGGMLVCGHGVYFNGEDCPYCRKEDERKTPHERAVEAELKMIRRQLESSGHSYF